MKRYLTAGLNTFFALVLFGMSQIACAQQATYLNAPSPEKIAVTAGGVDIRTGRYAYSATDVSAGDGGGAISVERTMPTSIVGHVAPFGNFSHNWNILLVIDGRPIDQYPGQSDFLANVHFGGRSQSFEMLYLSDSMFRQKSQNDFTRLTTTGPQASPGSVYTYQATDGTVAVFRPLASGECALANSSLLCAFVSYIVEADGTRYDFEYEINGSAANTARLRSVTSSKGYAALFEYGGSWNHISKTCVINLGNTAKPTNNICPTTAPQAANFTYTSVDGRTAMATAVAPDSSVDTFNYSAVTPGVGYQMAFTKAGQGSPWLTNTNVYSFTSEGATEPTVTVQSFADGSSFQYFYDYTPLTDDGMGTSSSFQTVAGGLYQNALNEITEVRYDFPATPGSFNPPRSFANGIGQPAPPVNYGDIVYQVTTGPARIIDALGRTTTNDYCDANALANLPPQEQNRCLVRQLQFIMDPEGNKTQLKYGVNNNITEIRRVAKAGSGLADTLETATYDLAACTSYQLKVCNKPLTVTDAKGKVTDYTWAASHGGMLTETLAAPTTGADRPQKRYTYAQFNAWYKKRCGYNCAIGLSCLASNPNF